MIITRPLKRSIDSILGLVVFNDTLIVPGFVKTSMVVGFDGRKTISCPESFSCCLGIYRQRINVSFKFLSEDTKNGCRNTIEKNL